MAAASRPRAEFEAAVAKIRRIRKRLGAARGTKPNISTVWEGLALGDAACANSLPLLTREKITHVLTVATSMRPAFPGKLEYLVVPVKDKPGEAKCLAERLDNCFDFIDRGRQAGGRVLVHCLQGISRSPTVVIAYLMRKRGWSLDEAMAHVRKVRGVVAPNSGFLTMLRRLGSEWARRTASGDAA